MNRILAVSLALLASAALIFGAAFIRPSDTANEGQYKLSIGTAVTLNGDTDAEASVTTVAVITDSKGEIVDCVVDCGAFGISFDDVKAQKNGEYITKGELGDGYNMVAYGGAKAEWFEQAEYFAKYVKGMNARDVAFIGLKKGGYAESADLTAGCTISLSDFKVALVKAMGDTLAVSFESEKAPVLSLAMINSDKFSEPSEGSYPVEMSTSVCAVASLDGKVLAAVTDIADSKFNYSGDGTVSEMSFGGTKREKLDSYGMKGASPIGKEWYEQADAFCEYIKGFDANKIAGIKIGESGKAENADLLAGCTVTVGGFTEIAQKALKAAE